MAETIEIVVSDPWEFGTEHGVGPFSCRLLNMNEDGRSASAQLFEPIVIGDVACGFVAIHNRFVRDSLKAVFDGKQVGANFMFGYRREDLDQPLAAGPYAGIGSIRLHGEPPARAGLS